MIILNDMVYSEINAMNPLLILLISKGGKMGT